MITAFQAYQMPGLLVFDTISMGVSNYITKWFSTGIEEKGGLEIKVIPKFCTCCGKLYPIFAKPQDLVERKV